jgi:hypothetical protein
MVPAQIPVEEQSAGIYLLTIDNAFPSNLISKRGSILVLSSHSLNSTGNPFAQRVAIVWVGGAWGQ